MQLNVAPEILKGQYFSHLVGIELVPEHERFGFFILFDFEIGQRVYRTARTGRVYIRFF